MRVLPARTSTVSESVAPGSVSPLDTSFLLQPSLFWPQRESSSKPASAACPGYSSCCSPYCCSATEVLGIGVAVGAFVGPAVSRQAEIGSCVDISFLLRPSLFWPQRESASKPASAACLGHSSCCCSAIEIVVERCLV